MKAFVTLPSWDRYIHCELFPVLAEMSADDRCDSISFPKGRPYEHALNIAVRDFLNTDCSHWINIDSDNVPTKNLLELIELDLDFIGCPYMLWQNDGVSNPIRWGVICLDGDKPTHKGLQAVEATASGSMVVSRRVLEGMKRPFERLYDDQGLVKRGVDYYFCDKIRNRGFKVYTHWDYRSKHFQDCLELSEIAYSYDKLCQISHLEQKTEKLLNGTFHSEKSPM